MTYGTSDSVPLVVSLISHSWSSRTGAGRCATELRQLLLGDPEVLFVSEAFVPPPETSAFARGVHKFRRLLRLVRLFRRHGVQVVIVNTTVLSSVALAARLAGCRVVWWSHEAGVALGGPMMRVRLYAYERLAHVAVVVCSSPPMSKPRCVQIRNIVTLDAGVRPESPPVVLVLGGKGWRKGTDLIHTLLHPFELPTSTELWVVGPEESRDLELVRQARHDLEKVWGSQLRWLPAVDDVGEVLLRASVLVLPSRGEARPRVVEEALAAGVPVVSNDLPGLRDIAQTVSDRRALQLLDLTEDWTDAVSSVLGSTLARQSHIESFTPDQFLKSWMSVIKGVVR